MRRNSSDPGKFQLDSEKKDLIYTAAPKIIWCKIQDFCSNRSALIFKCFLGAEFWCKKFRR
jgi:hypothetical protein